jgi:hypothetical protein
MSNKEKVSEALQRGDYPGANSREQAETAE